MNTKIEDRRLSVEKIANYVSIQCDTDYKWIERESLPAHKVSSLWKFRQVEVNKWLTTGNGETQKPQVQS
jgi:excisionase family DNA binding protein